MFNRIVFAVGLALVAPLAAQAQDPGAVHVSRDSLAQLLARTEQTANSRAYSDALRERARKEAELLRNRLKEGDFQVGDRIYLQVEGQPELTDTFTVRPGPVLTLPSLRDFALTGLLRSELQPQLEQHLRRFLVNPQVVAVPLMRIWMDGGVNVPGVYLMPAQSLVTDALMKAGGTSRGAKIDAIRIERGGERIWEGEALQRAITEGRTLDQLSLRAGDRIVVGEAGSEGGGLGRLGGVLLGLIPLLTLILQVL